MIIITQFGIGTVILMNNEITYNLKTIFSIILDGTVDPTHLIDLQVSGGNISHNTKSIPLMNLNVED